MGNSVLNELIGAMDGPLMMRHLEEFARWEKESGTPGELSSLEYVQKEMDAYGYATELILHDAYISLPGKARVTARGEEFRCITHSFSRQSGPEGLTAALVYVGSGDEAGFRGAYVAGRIVLVDGIANPAVSRRATRAGAAGQLHISPHEHVHEMCISPVWGSPDHQTRDDLPGTVVVSVPLETGEHLKRELVADAGLEVTLNAEVDTRWRPTPILVAELPGPEGGEDEPFVLYTGHHDTWYYGVMDNGGANATMMEVARLAALKRDRWQRGLRVIFWSGHSQGRYSGSTWYADENWEELEARAVAHVNVDSTGGKGNIIVADATAANELAAIAREALRTQAGQEFTGRRNGRAGDQSFWGIGVPAIFGNMSEQPASDVANASAAVFGGGDRKGAGTGWWWHTPDDLLDKMDEENLVRDTNIYLHTVWRLLADPVLPLDYREHAAMLTDLLSGLQKKLGERFDVSPLLARARDLGTQCETLSTHMDTTDPARIARINACLMAVSRALVPVDYSLGDRFDHDPALAQPAYPSLQPLAELAALPDGTGDDARFLTVSAMRARNRVGVALRDANASLAGALADLSAAD